MKIVILTGSPHRKGTSEYLVSQFTAGAEEAGHEVYCFDSAFKNVGCCLGCDKCEFGKKDCVLKDDFEELKPHMLEADMVVYASPLWYFSISAQLKKVIDRFYGINSFLMKKKIKTALLLTCGGTNPETVVPVTSEYELINDYFGWKDVGRVIAYGVMARADIEATDYGKKAYELGKSL